MKDKKTVIWYDLLWMDFTMTPNMLTGKQCPTTLIDFIYKTEK
jgi:hypothetical protein